MSYTGSNIIETLHSIENYAKFIRVRGNLIETSGRKIRCISTSVYIYIPTLEFAVNEDGVWVNLDIYLYTYVYYSLQSNIYVLVIRELRPPVALYVTRAMPLGVVTHPIRVTTVVVKWLAVLGSSDHADPTHPLSLMLSIATSNKFDSVRHYNFFFFISSFPHLLHSIFFFFFRSLFLWLWLHLHLAVHIVMSELYIYIIRAKCILKDVREVDRI